MKYWSGIVKKDVESLSRLVSRANTSTLLDDRVITMMNLRNPGPPQSDVIDDVGGLSPTGEEIANIDSLNSPPEISSGNFSLLNVVTKSVGFGGERTLG